MIVFRRKIEREAIRIDVFMRDLNRLYKVIGWNFVTDNIKKKDSI